jgi:hypothetical protein
MAHPVAYVVASAKEKCHVACPAPYTDYVWEWWRDYSEMWG